MLGVRPVGTNISGLIFKQTDLSVPVLEMQGYCDSLSCLHALEYYGLGRYGDMLDPFGYVSGFANISRILKSNGVLYLEDWRNSMIQAVICIY